jgi:hypothetical protein
MADKDPARREKSRALGVRLKAMFRALKRRPTPERLVSTLDRLEAADAQPNLKKTG